MHLIRFSVSKQLLIYKRIQSRPKKLFCFSARFTQIQLTIGCQRPIDLNVDKSNILFVATDPVFKCDIIFQPLPKFNQAVLINL